MRGIAHYGQLVSLFFVIAVLVAACGDRTPLDVDLSGTIGGDDAGLDSGTLPLGCGDGVCKSNESCSTCSVDCGFCAGCGDKQCSNGEVCSSCPQDCGVCPETCGDGFCKGNETCLTCAPDCGNCPGCGDKKCDAKNEDCFTCPDDCGKCMGCGDGICNGTETCASCSSDCGVCSVCGNMKCEAPYETCSNCAGDCGACNTTGCLQTVTCAFGCINMNGGNGVPQFSATCLANCIADGCPNVQFFVDQVLNCAVGAFPMCKGQGQGQIFSCVQNLCGTAFAACFGATCK